jgi:hypothetical protein
MDEWMGERVHKLPTLGSNLQNRSQIPQTSSAWASAPTQQQHH